MAEPGVVTPRPAATVVLLRPGPSGFEVLLTRRPASMAFAGDMYVFPGGAVDVEDATLGPAHAVAAIREAWEEAGILLADTPADPASIRDARARLVAGTTSFATLVSELGMRLRTDVVRPLSRWVTPPGYPRRFDARFFVTTLPGGAEPTLHGDEVVSFDWWRPHDALEAMAEGRIGMWLPTSGTLQQLEHVSCVADLDRLAPDVGAPGDVVVDEPADGVVRVVMPAGGGVEGQPVCAFLVGRRRFVLVDPGDPTGPALERSLEIVAERGGSIGAIALTQGAPDHHAGAEGLAERLGVEVLGGPGGGRHLPHAVREVEDGETLDASDIAIRALWTPGPRPDHVAFAVGDGAVLVGDLDGQRGSRSVLGPVDEDALARSRTRIDELGGGLVRLGGHPQQD
jgi:glyoxylase-like metal-dependent hydrolase (beta-lactamase superfamily II)/8-oxo-dGTP pyrophosphatase MutT (NUDIX family)